VPARLPARAHDWPIYLALLISTLAVYAQTASFEFVNLDDPDYVTRNPHVQAGWTAEGVKWAFTSREAANWFPLTRLSHMLDAQVFRLRSGAHHLTNAALHALAAMLLFAFLKRATGARWASAFAAGVFALHPLHVESVAWVAERKDVLCAVFWFLALWAYVQWARRGAPRRSRSSRSRPWERPSPTRRNGVAARWSRWRRFPWDCGWKTRWPPASSI
jgi:hypothetical protein